MHGEQPDMISGQTSGSPDSNRTSLKTLRWLMTATTALTASSAFSAQASAEALYTTGGIAVAAILAGILSAAIISSIWNVRRRTSTETASLEVRAALSEASRKISSYEALIADNNRRIVIWDGLSGQVEVIGQLPPETGAPVQERDFTAFGKWLTPRSAADIEKAIDRLRHQGESFDLVVESQRGDAIEAQGRVSGGRSFVRFLALNSLRAELAELQIERDRLAATIASFQALLDTIDMPVWQRNDAGRLTWVNEAYGEAVEAKNKDDAVGQGRELLPTVAREKIRAAVTPEAPFHDKISTVVRGERTFFDVIDVKSRAGSAGMAIDTSAEEALREELKRTLKSHAEILDHLGTPVAIFDREQRLQFYNQAFQQLWELDLVFLESHPDNGALLDKLRAKGRLPEQLNWKSWRENALSVYRSVETQTDIWYLPNGQTLRVFANALPQGGATWVFENLTEKVNLETLYNSLVKVQEETINHLAEGVAVFGPDGKLKLSNPAFRKLWALGEDDAKPGTHIRAIEKACAQTYAQPDGWRLFGQAITSFEDERANASGSLELATGLVLDYAITPLPNAQTMLTFVDMTDSVLAERALTEKNAALRKADEIKNDFVQHVSYELRSPLTNIIGFTDLLKTPTLGTLNERQAEYVEHISTSSAILLTIVNDILDLATLDAGIMQLDFAPIALDGFLDEVALQIAERLQEGSITLQITAPPDLGTINADRQRMKQILLKILTNSANFAPENSTIRLKCWRDGNDFVFKVSDEGSGIPKEILDTIFNRFEAHGKGRGAGLGLAIVDSFVTLHGGKVNIDSVEGRGTEVTCRIPSHILPDASSVAAE
jgi:signal transduction histidine kinase